MMNFEVCLDRSETKFVLSVFDEKAKKLLSEIAEASGTGDIEATVLKAAQLNVVNNFGLAIARVIAEKDAELKDKFQQLQAEPKAEQKPEEPKPTKEAKPKAEKPKKSHDPSVLYVSKEDRDPTPRLAYSGKGRRPAKTCATCLLFKGDHCVNGDKVTKDHVCDMFEKF